MTWLTLRSRASRRLAGLLGLVLFLALQLFVTAGPLHQAVHADANAPGHRCVISLFAHGQVNSPGLAPVIIGLAAALCFLLPLFRAALLRSFDYRLSPSRAPPRS